MASLESGDVHHFQMLQLNSITPPPPPPPQHHQHHAASSSSEASGRPLERCTSCGSIKRRSPSSIPSLQEPSPKRAALHHSDAPAGNAVGSSNPKQAVLGRSVSDITSYMGTQEINPQSEEISKNNSLPPLPPILERSISDPNLSNYQPVEDPIPSKPPAARTLFPPPGSEQESSHSRKLSRIQEKMQKFCQWVEKVASEEDMNEDNCSLADDNKSPKEMSENEPETARPAQEAIWVEEKGENLMIHFKCPCSRGYEVFISGKKCYYRLI
ncbi:hypothetical protein M9H77_35794 [Catharanthus roseus]|uniref:Uncharacterized protein n=1 Tax=Catharanthus roseus TaxID=4058 RepID=A0ACB9ZQ11_CATRO|nr:hypothetical protein M9H77_35794 [Catharanthus roseus]